ncbi:hypothetical protein BIW11_12880 [Tropilaelaps mercedesae]|uniref:Carboxypeptidase inhibitor n=1 Tax=Tropilaelaps mercedesae TaxID=418985 RepID=A0A1V9X4I6_9ACAR|nr:hypothetical protein BIW11_12880 [Tropilaelaps mercedesae]
MAMLCLTLLFALATASYGITCIKYDRNLILCNSVDFHGCMPVDRCSKNASANKYICESKESVCCDFRLNTKNPCPNVFGGICTVVAPGNITACRQPAAARETCGEGKKCCVLLS